MHVSPARSFLELTNVLQPLVSKCRFGWPAFHFKKYTAGKLTNESKTVLLALIITIITLLFLTPIQYHIFFLFFFSYRIIIYHIYYSSFLFIYFPISPRCISIFWHFRCPRIIFQYLIFKFLKDALKRVVNEILSHVNCLLLLCMHQLHLNF